PGGHVPNHGTLSRIRTVLLIEDASASVAIMTRYLDELGLRTIVHRQGTGAIERVGRENPDVVLLDLILPDADGWELLSALRSDPDSREIPVLVISDLDERARGLTLGAAGYLVN